MKNDTRILPAVVTPHHAVRAVEAVGAGEIVECRGHAGGEAIVGIVVVMDVVREFVVEGEGRLIGCDGPGRRLGGWLRFGVMMR